MSYDAGGAGAAGSVQLFDLTERDDPFSMSLIFRRPAAGSGGDGSISGGVNLPLPSTLNEAFRVAYKKSDATMTAFVGELFLKGINEYRTMDTIADETKGKRIARAFSNVVVETLEDPTLVTNASAVVKAGAEAALGSGPALGGFLFNPNMANIFDGVDPRSFQFDWKIHPRDAGHAQDLMDTIHEIKQRILPPKAGNFGPMEIIRYPDVVDIEVMIAGQAGYFPVKQCIVSNFQVDYMASGGASFFTDGKPTSISFSMTVQETKSLTRDDIAGMPTFGAS